MTSVFGLRTSLVVLGVVTACAESDGSEEWIDRLAAADGGGIVARDTEATDSPDAEDSVSEAASGSAEIDGGRSVQPIDGGSEPPLADGGHPGAPSGEGAPVADVPTAVEDAGMLGSEDPADAEAQGQGQGLVGDAGANAGGEGGEADLGVDAGEGQGSVVDVGAGGGVVDAGFGVASPQDAGSGVASSQDAGSGVASPQDAGFGVAAPLDAGQADAAVTQGPVDAGEGDVDAGASVAGETGAGEGEAAVEQDAGSVGVDGLLDAGVPLATADAGVPEAPVSDGGLGEVVDADILPEDGGQAPLLDPALLFNEAVFGGNGRTCLTCHTAETGTISPEQVQALYASDPTDPLFRPIDSDDGQGDDYTLLRERATFRVEIPLPEGVSLASDPGATSVVLRRSVPTNINTPGLDPTLMWDGRAPDLMEQALGAILGHAEATVTPTPEQLVAIAEFQQGVDFYSSDILWQYFQGGAEPVWPPGNTPEEQRGRRWFAEDPGAPFFNICGQCHGGPMTNEIQPNARLATGEHFETVGVSEVNTADNPVYRFVFPDPRRPGQTVVVETPDPGLALTTGDVRHLNFFKIPTLWGVKDTAPYFHDNSAADLEELMERYEDHLATFLSRFARFPTPKVPSDRDKADIIAYLKLL